MIGIIVPAHDEEQRIEDCVQSLVKAAAHPDLAGEEVKIIVVVGIARQTGAKIALASGARWLAFTDADSVVASDWLACQLALKADAVCGTIAVEDWGAYGERMHRHFQLTYNDVDGHSHIHGANLGVSAEAYSTAGGFLGLESSEDVALVEALRTSGAKIAWSRAPRVVTSVRPNYKAPSGFGATLERIEKLRQWVGVEMGVPA
jgi:hypothetical protein